MKTITSDELEEKSYEVEFMTLVVDKADDLRIVDSDSHFSDFSGVHPSKIKQGKLTLLEILKPIDRERVMKSMCKENTRFVYIDFDILNKDGEPVYVHCSGQNYEDSAFCRLTLADISKSRAKQEKLQAEANEMNNLIDLVNGGVCLFKVSQNMHIEALYLNEGCCRLFGTSKSNYRGSVYRVDELIHPDDRSAVFQAIGKTMAVGDDINMECRILGHKNAPLWCMLSAGIQSYDEDNCPIFHAIFTDISAVKEAEKKADAESEKLTRVFKNLPGPIFLTNSNTPLQAELVSEDYMRFLGYTRTEFFDFFGGNVTKLMDSEDAKRIENEISTSSKTEKVIHSKYVLHTAKNGDIEVHDRRKIISHDDGTRVTIGILLPI